MRIAVTGASGRIGTAVVAAALAGGHEVVALDRATAAPPDPGPAADATPVPPSTFVTPDGTTDAAAPVAWLDVTDLEAFTAQIDRCDALIHLAAIPSPWGRQAADVHANNVLGSYHAFLAAAEVGIRRVAWASSINAIGGYYSRAPRFDYFPVDEDHPSYAEDAYSLSKWLGEQQADAMARLHPDLSIASIRLHGARAEHPRIRPRAEEEPTEDRLRTEARHLWGWVDIHAVARAFLSALTADFTGHEAFFVVAPTTTTSVPSAELRSRFYPDVPLRRSLEGHAGFYDCGKAAKLLGWTHDT
ncbi:NAD(P)-dependent oxidoreductase [Actinopolymorpha sp. B17G11]|uniref:NAD-dependent epimerase/dehydratase family protein n=1 Tax=unclassified Actinopolymorpha TaxID=2627063 RepID=UPI0032D9A375